MPAVTTFITQGRFNPPEQGDAGLPGEDGVTALQGALTMREGMRQKSWTIMTDCLEALVLEELGFNGDIMGQRRTQKGATGNFREQSPEAGLILKSEECWASDILCKY